MLNRVSVSEADLVVVEVVEKTVVRDEVALDDEKAATVVVDLALAVKEVKNVEVNLFNSLSFLSSSSRL